MVVHVLEKFLAYRVFCSGAVGTQHWVDWPWGKVEHGVSCLLLDGKSNLCQVLACCWGHLAFNEFLALLSWRQVSVICDHATFQIVGMSFKLGCLGSLWFAVGGFVSFLNFVVDGLGQELVSPLLPLLDLLLAVNFSMVMSLLALVLDMTCDVRCCCKCERHGLLCQLFGEPLELG